MQNVFTYGSLMFPEVWGKIVQGEYESVKGTLHGFRRRSLKDEPYPVVFEGAPSERVAGVVYMNVSEEDVAKLDVFEGELYDRLEVQITSNHGKEITAQAYILKEDFYHKVTQKPWDVEDFKLVGLARFLEEYQGFERV